jgi:hypothetical protein
VCSSLLLSASCGENPGPPPPTGYSTQVADYSTPEERIAQEFHLPQIDLAQAEADQANPMPFPLGEVTGTAGTVVRLRGAVLRVPGEFHDPPMIIVQKRVGDPKRRTVNTRTAQWGKFDRSTGRHEYTIELNLPSTPGQYELVLTTQHVDMAAHKAGPRFELGRGTLKVLPAPKKPTAP